MLQLDLRLNITGRFQQDQTAGLRQVLVHRTCSPAKDAVDRNSQSGGFTIHCSSTTNNQIREPDKVQAIHYMFGDDDLCLFEEGRPLASQLGLLGGCSWE